MMARLGRKLIEMLRELLPPRCKLLMDKAYCGAATRRLAEECGLEPVVPPKSNAKKPWRYDVVCPVLVRPVFWALGHRALQETERGRTFFCRVKRFRRIATRYDKLDVIFLGFLLFAFVVDFLLLC